VGLDAPDRALTNPAGSTSRRFAGRGCGPTEVPVADRPRAGQAGDAVDVERRLRVGRGPVSPRDRGRRGRLVEPSPVLALTARTSGPDGTRSLVRRDLLGLDQRRSSSRDDAALDAEQPQDRKVLVVCAARPSAASTTSRKRSMPVAPATIVRTKRSCPGTSTSDSRRPSGSSSGA
jgi:hypothetical protein